MSERPRVWLVWTMLGVFGALFVLMERAGGSTLGAVLDRFGALRPDLVFGPEAWRLVSSGLIHIGVLHLLTNAWALFALGPTLESAYGARGLWAIFVLSVVGGGLAQTAVGQGGAGASGGLFGLVAVYVVFYFRFRNAMPPQEAARMKQWLISIAAINVFVAISVPNIGHAAHFGGFVTGLACAVLMKPASREGTTQILFTWLVACMSAAAMIFAAIHAAQYSADAQRAWTAPSGEYTLMVPTDMAHREVGPMHVFANSESAFAVSVDDAREGWREHAREEYEPGTQFAEEGGVLVIRGSEDGDRFEARYLERGGRVFRFRMSAWQDFDWARARFLRFVASLEVH